MLRKATVIAALLATMTAVTACGGSGSSNGNGTASARTNAGLKLAECMRTHGVAKFPDPGNGPNRIQASRAPSGGGAVSVDGVALGISPQTLQKAMSECQQNLPHGPPISGAQLAAIKQGALKMAECMRAHGVPNFPDPQVTSGPGGHGISVTLGGGPNSPGGGNAVNPSSPAFNTAQKICMPLLRVGPKQPKVGN